MEIKTEEVVKELNQIYILLTHCPENAQRRCISCEPIIEAALLVKKLIGDISNNA